MPEPLPSIVEPSPQTWRVVSEAMLSLGRLDQAGRQIAPPSDVLELDPDDEEPARRSPELCEVLGYVRAAEYAYEGARSAGFQRRRQCAEIRAMYVLLHVVALLRLR